MNNACDAHRLVSFIL